MTAGLQLGRPGVYVLPPKASTALQPVRLDITGFVGVAGRGPVDRPIQVSNWSEFERWFGGVSVRPGEPDRLLGYAVRSFFAQGGQRAYVVRVAPPPDFDGPTGDEATATYSLPTPAGSALTFAAGSEGSWGGSLDIRLDFTVSSAFQSVASGATGVVLPAGTRTADQSLVRLHGVGLPVTGEFRWLTAPVDPETGNRTAVLDRPLPEPADRALTVEVVTGELVITDFGSAQHRQERLADLGLCPGHPRFIGTVLAADSALLRVIDEPLAVQPDRFLQSMRAVRVTLGLDRDHGIDRRSFFDDDDAADDPLDEITHRGADLLGRVGEIGLLCAPDLYWRVWLPTAVPVAGPAPDVRQPTCRNGCAPSSTDEVPQAPPRTPSVLDARNPAERAEIVWRQRRLVDIAVLRRRFVVLLDVPPGLSVGQITAWRANFDTAYAAAYHPWLAVPRTVPAPGDAVDVPPSGFAAGIIAAREARLGLPWGPANEIAVGAVRAVDLVTDSIHDQLHLQGVNVYRAERDGFRLSAARTLSQDKDFRQLSVRRVMTMLALTLDRQTQWLVFEPNTADLRERLTDTVVQFLRQLQRRGWFAGATSEQSFFVRCDDSVNPDVSLAQGRLIAEIGVAPASPLEYLILRVTQDVDGAISVVTSDA